MNGKSILDRPVEMKKILGGATKFEILLATMVGRRREFFISNCLKGLEKFNICRRWVNFRHIQVFINIIDCLESVL